MKNGNVKKVLVVDNDEQVLSAIRSLLEDAGFDTQTTWSGRDALSALESGRVDLLLTDDYLPDLHAADFLDRVGQLRVHPAIVVMHKGPQKPSAVRRYEALGAYSVVDKNDLAAVCRAVMSCGSKGKLEPAMGK